MPWARLQSLLTRVTSSGEVIAVLDGVRFLALIAVIVHHVLASYLKASKRFGTVDLPADWHLLAGDWFVRLNLHLTFAVPVFFALSGFILANPFARRYRANLPSPPMRLYFLRRLVRLEPPYIASCLVYFLAIVLPFAHHDFPGYFGAFFPHLAASLFYLHGLVYGQASWINGVAWSLEVEIQFYILLPLLVTLLKRPAAPTRRWILLALILGTSLLSQFAIEPSANERLRLSLANYIHYFLAGLLTADLYLDRSFPQRKSFFGDLAGAMAALLIFFILHRYPGAASLLPVLLIPLLCGVLCGKCSAAILGSPVVTLPGGMCYTVYLYHELILRTLQPYTLPFSPASMPVWAAVAVQCVLLIPVIFAVSTLLFLAVERPFMVLSRNTSRITTEAVHV